MGRFIQWLSQHWNARATSAKERKLQRRNDSLQKEMEEQRKRHERVLRERDNVVERLEAQLRQKDRDLEEKKTEVYLLGKQVELLSAMHQEQLERVYHQIRVYNGEEPYATEGVIDESGNA